MQYLAHSAQGDVPEQSYTAHVAEVTCMAIANAAGIAPFAPASGHFIQDAVRYAALFHDLGKLDMENQKVLCSGKGPSLPINHVDAGAAHLLGSPSALRNLVALAIYSHHVGLPSFAKEWAKGTGKVFRDEEIKATTDARLAEYLKAHESCLGRKEIPDINVGELPALFMRMGLSCLVDADHTDTARHYQNAVPDGKVPLSPANRLGLLDRYVSGLSSAHAGGARTSLRQEVYDACRNALPEDSGIIACDSPVGTGKTTAVMAHLLNVARQKNLRRIFVVLPFTNIINQSVDVYRKALVLDDENAKLVVAAHHHRAEFEDPKTRAYSFLWNAPVTVTTAVQFFETLASNRPAALRKLHQLPGSAIFLDEAHAALPAHLWPQAWKWLCELAKAWGCYIVMASGSLTRFWELEEFSSDPKPLEELVQKNVRDRALDAETVRVRYREKQPDLELSELGEWVRTLPGPRLVILNTVQSAAALANALAGPYRKERDKVEHISTALTPAHREKTIERIKQRLANANDTDWTLVATSCVEAGMDFSFRTAAREVCSLVSAIQSAGRINRSGGISECDLWSFSIIPGDMLKTHRSFKTSATILEDLFREGKVDAQHCKEAMRREIRRNNLRDSESDPIVRAEKNGDFPEVEQMFKVIDSNTITVLADRNIIELLDKGQKLTPSDIQSNSVNIYSSKIDEYALRALDHYPGLYAWMLEYDDLIGYMAGVLTMLRHNSEGTII